jgi:hypothetical protein
MGSTTNGELVDIFILHTRIGNDFRAQLTKSHPVVLLQWDLVDAFINE